MPANDSDIDASEAARLEHRLTKLEQAVLAHSEATERGFKAVTERLDMINGKVGKHEVRLNDHDLLHARADGARDERMRLRLLDRSLIVVSAMAGVAAVVLGAVLQ